MLHLSLSRESGGSLDGYSVIDMLLEHVRKYVPQDRVFVPGFCRARRKGAHSNFIGARTSLRLAALLSDQRGIAGYS
jgi:hypothetical protein